MQQNLKQYALQAMLKLMPWPSLFSEDIYALVKSCSCFFEISYYHWYLILCHELLLSKLCPGSVCLEHNLDLSYFALKFKFNFISSQFKVTNIQIKHQEYKFTKKLTQLVLRYDQATISKISFDIWMNPYAGTRLILKGSPQNKIIQNYMYNFPF